MESASVAEPDDVADDFYDPALQPTSTLAYESHGVHIAEPHLVTESGRRVNCLQRGRRYRYRYRAEFERSAEAVRFGMMIKTLSGMELGGGVSAADLTEATTVVEAGASVEVAFDFDCNLNPGTYFLNAGVTGLAQGTDTYLHRLLDACLFRVMPVSRDSSTGIVNFHCTSVIEQTVNDEY